MLKVFYSPQCIDAPVPTLEKTSGDRLRINGELFNFGTLPDGATIPRGAIPCEWIDGPVERVGDEVRITILLPHGLYPEPHMAFPEPMNVTDDGPIDVPHPTYIDVAEARVEGGRTIRTETRAWKQPIRIEERFVPDPPPLVVADPSKDETANVDA